MSEIGSVPPQPVPASSGGAQPASPQATQTQPVQTQPVPSQPALSPPAPASPAGSAPPAQQTPPTSNPAGAAQISEALRALANGGQFAAQVVARDGAALLVRTATGATLSLTNLATALEQANIGTLLNAALKLQLNPNNPQLASVVSANGVSFQPPLATTAQPPTAAQLALAAAPPVPPGPATPAAVLPQAGQVLTATVLPAVTSGPVLQAGTPPLPLAPRTALPPGSQVQVVVQSATPPLTPPIAPGAPAASAPMPVIAPLPGNPAPAAAPNLSAAMPSVAPAPAAGASSVPSPTILSPPAVAAPTLPLAATPPSQSISAPPIPAQPSTSPAISPVPLPTSAVAQMPTPRVAAGAMIAGIVSGQGQAGQVLVSTPQAVLSLNLPQPLPVGTQIIMEVVTLTRPPTPAATALGPAPLGGVLTRLQGDWSTLQQTFDALRAADPALAQRLQADLLPQPNARLASTALQFMAAAAIGNAQAWLGADAVRRLERDGRGDLLRKLDEDFGELGRLNQRQGDNQWQALVMPMLVGGKIEPIQIFMRRRRDQRKQQQQTRFIIDFNLESTGPIQFDGFVSTKQLDLILRSETEFGPAFRLDVSTIFENALQITGMTGTIQFRDHEAPLAWPSPELEGQGPSTEIKA